MPADPVQLVDPVDDSVLGQLGAAGGGEGGEPVGYVHDVVTAAPRRDVAGPAHDAGSAQVALAAGEVGPFPVSGCAPPEQNVFGSVVSGEDNESV